MPQQQSTFFPSPGICSQDPIVPFWGPTVTAGSNEAEALWEEEPVRVGAVEQPWPSPLPGGAGSRLREA